MPDRLKIKLKQLPLSRKLVLFGSTIATLSVFLKWYEDIDKFNTGDVFFGITGPLYLAGLVVLLASVACFTIIVLGLLNRPVPKLPLTENHFFIAMSSVILFMLVLVLSVYSHPKFGINLLNKSVGLGMIVAFAGSGLVLLGAFLSIKNKGVEFTGEGSITPLISVKPTDRVPSGLSVDDTIEVKSAIQESIEDFTRGESDYKEEYEESNIIPHE